MRFGIIAAALALSAGGVFAQARLDQGAPPQPSAAVPTAPPTGDGILAAIPPDGSFASNLIDLELTSGGKRVGEIEDIRVGPDGKVDGYIVAVGGARTGGSVKHVAVAASAITVGKGGDGKWKAETTLPPGDFEKAAPVTYRSGFNAE